MATMKFGERVGKEGHMDGLALVDTMGATSIHAMQFFVRTMKNRFPDIPLEAHFHMDFGMGIANTIMALSEGVEVIQSTVLGVGERAGNVPMEETVMALKCLYNIDIGIKTEQFKKLADMVAEISNIQIASNRPIVGDNLFNPDPYYQQGGDMVRVSGMHYRCHPARKHGERISEMRLESGELIESSKHYSVAGWATTQQQSKGLPVWSVVIDYLRQHSGERFSPAYQSVAVTP